MRGVIKVMRVYVPNMHNEAMKKVGFRPLEGL
jgi:hypothetical protein